MASEVIDLGFRARAWQAESFQLMRGKRFGVEVVHRRAGKTVKALAMKVARALEFQGERGRFGYVAPQLKQAKTIAWDYLKGYARRVPGTEIHEAELRVTFPHNGAQIRLFGADNPDSLRGGYFDGVTLDEPAQMKLEVWGEIIQPMLADRKGWGLFIGTPKGMNLLSDLYHRALVDPEWYAHRWDCYQTDALDPAEIERLRKEMTAAQFAQEMLCDFDASSDDVLVPLSVAREAAQRHYRIEDYGQAARILGVDVARFGGDRSAIFRRQGIAAFPPKVWQGIDTMTFAGHVAQEIAEWQPDAVFIDASPASYGVIDRLTSLGHKVVSVDFGGRADSPQFNNKRSEMWHRLAQWLRNEGGAVPDDVALLADLCAPQYDHGTGDGKMRLEPKDKIKERLGASPDLGDALALTFAYPVRPVPRALDGTRFKAAGFDSYSGRQSGDGRAPYNPLG